MIKTNQLESKTAKAPFEAAEAAASWNEWTVF
jgi:hypothetical protein